MTVHLTPARRSLRMALAILATAGLILVVAVTPSLATHTGPLVDPDTETYDEPGDNPDCEDLFGEGWDGVEEKFDPADSGTQGNVTFTNDDEVGSFQTSGGWLVAAAIIKGGNEGASVYDYSGEENGGVDHDNGLTTPTGQAISHATFCLVAGPEATPTPTPEGSEAGGTGTPAPSVPDTATSLPGMAGPLATVVFGLILLGSLGALAYANVSAVRRRS